MKIKQKLIAGFIVVSLLVGLVGILGLYANDHIVKSYESGEKHFGSIVDASNEVSSYAKRTEGHTMLFLTLHNEADRKKFYQRIASLREQTSIIDRNISNPEARKILDKIKSETDELQSVGEALIAAYDNDTKTTGKFEPENYENLIRKLDDVAAAIRADGLDMAKVEVRLQGEQQQSANKNAAFLYNIILIISLAAVFSAIVFGYVVTRNISSPVTKLKEAAIDIGKGNFDTKIELDAKDEIGELAGAFSKMAKDLQKLLAERKLAEDQIKASLKEKEVLLQEVHHRVKNNLQVISSLLNLQSEQIQEEKSRAMLKDSQNRILSMSLIHEKLYQSKDFAKIDFNEYVRELVDDLFQSYGDDAGKIALNINVGTVSLGIDSAIPCGLIINELVTNSLKYAFPGGRKGELNISLRPTNGNMIELIVGDNGVGIPEDVDFKKTASLGLHIVTMLVEGQLYGEISLDRSKGTEFKIKFRGK